MIPGWEDTLEKETATHSSILAWGIPWTEEPGGLQSTGSQEVGHDLVTEQQQFLFTSLFLLFLICTHGIREFVEGQMQGRCQR